MSQRDWTQAIAGAHQRLDNLFQRASQPQEQSMWQNSPVVMLTEAIAEIAVSLEELNVLAEELQQQNEELIATRHLVEAERQRYQDLFNFAPDGYLVTDINGLIQEANFAAAELLKVRQSYLIGKPIAVFVHQSERHNLRQLMLQLRQHRQISAAELRMYHNEGSIDFPAELTAVMQSDPLRNLPSLRWLLRDISEKKQFQSQLIRIQRLESIGVLASGIAHDMNNILTPIMTVAQLLPMKHPNLDEDSQEMLNLLEISAQRGADLVKQIATFSRGSEGRRTSVKIANLIIDIAQIINQTFPKYINLNTDVAADLGTVFADSTQLHQVLMNLVVNARDAMPNGGELLISANNIFIDETYTKKHPEAKSGKYVLIEIIDNGVGIHPENLDRIFEPFFTTKEVGKGTGLGLSTVIGIINNLGGFITVSSQVGVGSQFQIYLPRGEYQELPIADADHPPPGKGELILVVDDELAITQITKAALESQNYRVWTAKNGIEALSIYTEHQAEIQLVLIDMMMPAMSGETAICNLKIINPQVRVIAMSGLTSSEALLKVSSTSIQGFLPKPFTPQELLKSIQEVLAVP